MCYAFVFTLIAVTMSPPLSSVVRGRIFALKDQGMSAFVIRKELLKSNHDVKISTINQHWRENLKKHSLKAENEQRPKRKRTRTVRTTEVVKKIKRLLASDNSPTQQAIGHRLGIRQQIVSQVVDQDLSHKRLKKPKAKHLSEAMVEKRKKRAKQFKKRVSGDNREYILTLDECMLPLDYTNGQSEYYYAPKNVKERDRPPPLATCAQQFPEQLMMAAGFTWRGPTRLYIVPPKTKITAEYFVKQVLTPMFDVDIPKLYGKEAGKVELHMDSASSHTA